jgi:hypothetical protein
VVHSTPELSLLATNQSGSLRVKPWLSRNRPLTFTTFLWLYSSLVVRVVTCTDVVLRNVLSQNFILVTFPGIVVNVALSTGCALCPRARPSAFPRPSCVLVHQLVVPHALQALSRHQAERNPPAICVPTPSVSTSSVSVPGKPFLGTLSPPKFPSQRQLYLANCSGTFPYNIKTWCNPSQLLVTVILVSLCLGCS